MKHILVCVLIALLFVQCNKDDQDSPANLLNLTASMSAKIDGTSWNAVTRVTRLQSNNFIITGTGALNGNDVIAITVLGSTAGTYNLDPMTTQVQFTANYTPVAGSTDSIYQAYQGSVVISSVDLTEKKVSGTFTFKARLQDMVTEVNITEGKFENLSYTE